MYYTAVGPKGRGIALLTSNPMTPKPRAANQPRTVASAYTTDFSEETVVLEEWSLDAACEHCEKRSGSECTQNTPRATTFGQVQDGKGMRHTTTALAPRSACGACASSGHATLNRDILYGNFTVVAAWFPEQEASTATGFIGLDSEENEASITMG